MLTKSLIRLHKTYAKFVTTRMSYTQMASNERVFLQDSYSRFTLAELNGLSKKLSENLLKNLNCTDLNGEKIAVLCSNNYSYLVSLMAVWQANGVPLGLNKHYPTNLLEYFLSDAKCRLVINGISPNESKAESQALNELLAKKNVHNYELVESEFYKPRADAAGCSDQQALTFFRELLNKPEDSNKESLILYTR